ncbi:hypothetical protein EYC84_008264 [Monilinia fructicola]|uniref:Uncharacterized protein n=1 Tax=Monilinia fructicola TaxID=38448 RepID=A0A5M9JDZ6_MONFR|nr:hypothetical protein EYC84_008264 [Monilinia fructicola]
MPRYSSIKVELLTLPTLFIRPSLFNLQQFARTSKLPYFLTPPPHFLPSSAIFFLSVQKILQRRRRLFSLSFSIYCRITGVWIVEWSLPIVIVLSPLYFSLGLLRFCRRKPLLHQSLTTLKLLHHLKLHLNSLLINFNLLLFICQRSISQVIYRIFESLALLIVQVTQERKSAHLRNSTFFRFLCHQSLLDHIRTIFYFDPTSIYFIRAGI